jgi:hypothetical protein
MIPPSVLWSRFSDSLRFSVWLTRRSLGAHCFLIRMQETMRRGYEVLVKHVRLLQGLVDRFPLLMNSLLKENSSSLSIIHDFIYLSRISVVLSDAFAKAYNKRLICPKEIYFEALKFGSKYRISTYQVIEVSKKLDKK